MPTSDRFPVVGIGASAGGIETLQAFFHAMPVPAPAIAFVVVTHLGAGHNSALPEILQKCAVILIPIDQNPCAHLRSPMDMMRQG